MARPLQKLDVIYDDRKALAKALDYAPKTIESAVSSGAGGPLGAKAKELLELHRREKTIGLDAVRSVLQLLSTLKQRDDMPESARSFVEEKAEMLRSHYLSKLQRLNNLH